MKQEEFVPERDLPLLRKQIRLGSLFYADYENDMGFARESVCDFFDGFLDFVYEIAKEDTGEKYPEWDEVMKRYDTDEYLIQWWYCFDWFPFKEVKEDENE